MNADGCGSFLVPNAMWRFLGSQNEIAEAMLEKDDMTYRQGYSDPSLEEKRRAAIDWLRAHKGWVLDVVRVRVWPLGD